MDRRVLGALAVLLYAIFALAASPYGMSGVALAAPSAGTAAPGSTSSPGAGAVEAPLKGLEDSGVTGPIEQFTIRRYSTVQQGVYYQNTGTRPDSYTVTVSGIPSSWWRFRPSGSSTVQPDQGRYGNLYITPRTTGDYTFTVKVTSRGDPTKYSAQTYTMHVR